MRIRQGTMFDIKRLIQLGFLVLLMSDQKILSARACTADPCALTMMALRVCNYGGVSLVLGLGRDYMQVHGDLQVLSLDCRIDDAIYVTLLLHGMAVPIMRVACLGQAICQHSGLSGTGSGLQSRPWHLRIHHLG